MICSHAWPTSTFSSGKCLFTSSLLSLRRLFIPVVAKIEHFTNFANSFLTSISKYFAKKKKKNHRLVRLVFGQEWSQGYGNSKGKVQLCNHRRVGEKSAQVLKGYAPWQSDVFVFCRLYVLLKVTPKKWGVHTLERRTSRPHLLATAPAL